MDGEHPRPEPSNDSPPTVEPLDRWRGRLTLVFAVLVGIGLLVGTLASQPGENPPSSRAPEPAPDFSVPLFDGSTFTLSEHLRDDGRPVVLNLFASWCLPCREEIPELSRFAVDRPDVLVLGVAVQDRWEDALALVEELTPTYPTGFDTDDQVLLAYPILGVPTTFVIAPDGTIAERYSGKLTYEDLAELVGG